MNMVKNAQGETRMWIRVVQTVIGGLVLMLLGGYRTMDIAVRHQTDVVTHQQRQLDDHQKQLDEGPRFTLEHFQSGMKPIEKEWSEELQEMREDHRADMRAMDTRIDYLEQGDVRILALLEAMQANLSRVEQKLDREWLNTMSHIDDPHGLRNTREFAP